jgi:hypothetical protein
MGIIHCSIDLDAIVHRGMSRDLAGNITLPAEPSRRATEAEVIAYATLLKARGFEVLPTCSNYDTRGYCRCHLEASPC